MALPDIQRIMQTCLSSKANEVLLVTGRPPLLRYFSEGVRTIHIEPLTPEDIITLVIDSLIPLDPDRKRMRAFYDKTDFCRWDYPFSSSPNIRFRVFLIRHGNSHLGILTPIGPDVPEMEYED